MTKEAFCLLAVMNVHMSGQVTLEAFLLCRLNLSLSLIPGKSEHIPRSEYATKRECSA